MLDVAQGVLVTLNGAPARLDGPPSERLSYALRERCGLTGVKVGCNAGDCGACTVLIDGEPVCACLTTVGQAEGRAVETVEGLSDSEPRVARLRAALHVQGAAQCGICTPAVLLAAVALLRREPRPSEPQIQDALGGVLCRCTGYRAIVEAVASAFAPMASEPGGVGARLPRLDGARKLSGAEIYGADEWPADALTARALRSPHAHAEFGFGDLDGWVAAHPGVVAVFTAKDVPGENCFGVIPAFADQPALAERRALFRGEPVALIVGDEAAMRALDLRDFPVTFTPLPALTTLDAALAEDAPRLHAGRPGNILTRGRVARGDAAGALAAADVVVEGAFETGFVEHAYIEPEAGFARRVGDRIEVQACTQAPYMDRDGVAGLLGIAPEAVRILPTAVGGGFGSKLDLSLQPFVAIAAWKLNRPVRMTYARTESMQSTTKRHPAVIRARIGAGRDGRLTGMAFEADFNTGAYASWGPTVANRVPVHASGPYLLPNYRAEARAVHTHLVPAGAFRGFGVPQSALAQEQLFDELALKLGLDPLEFRILNALVAGEPTVTGQVFADGLGFKPCLEALRPRWRLARAEAEAFNAAATGPIRRGVGVAGMWYGCGNTSLSNPSTIRVGLKPDGRVSLFQGAVDIGQGSNTVVTQIFAEALGARIEVIDLIGADTDMTPDCGKTSASRQTFVTGNAARLAGLALRKQILRLANVGEDAALTFAPGAVVLGETRVELVALPVNQAGFVIECVETYDPPTTTLDENGQGEPYAVFGSGAHLAEIEVDVELGRVRVTRLTCAHDVGRAINPTLVEGQIEGGAAQGLGLALMEEYIPHRSENLHDYLIPTIGDMPPVDCILIEDPSSEGPFGAKGIGEQALIPTAPAIFNAIHHATGVRLTRAPATPDRLLKALKRDGRSG
jgi:CO/xanthine dehydrogenase Mo-binding subunit/aerobic-type carbon monoxide dehydrogenase small subunit (CoxS/CutS family)